MAEPFYRMSDSDLLAWAAVMSRHLWGRWGRASTRSSAPPPRPPRPPPNDPAAWHFVGLMTRARFTLDFARRTGADTVWVSAHWYNARGEPDPSAAPASVNLPANAPMAVETSAKLAA